MGTQAFKDTLARLAEQSFQATLSVDDLDKLRGTLTTIEDKEADRKNKTFIQRSIIRLLYLQNIGLLYLMLCQGIGAIMPFFTHKFTLQNTTIHYYIVGSCFLTYQMLRIILKYHFPERQNVVDKMLALFFKKSNVDFPDKKIEAL